ncbi:MAG TPA: SAM-dependent methyltransferase [Frateuria sp.]|uniref:SAM-dependent methyltransferase n=1 Tax=Frateuria sp. TaxID=2211372 RepID=UPI002D7EBADF|nr:SAM-dependent methyltransferase [Frateuria sp.]HET6805426.1 SAM-dependent methyltransferase [Frateuria sp.]
MDLPSLPLPEGARRGSLACVGLGMTLGSHLTPLARSHIEQADVVFAGLSDGIVELWLQRMHPDVRSLQPYYAEGKSRLETYREWVGLMMAQVRAGKRVCGVFYGHPGIFAWSPHKAVATARAEGFEAHMEPGVSAEDCLYADLGIDPGRFGCQHYEASQLLLFERRIDPTAYLVLWQVGLVGDRSLTRFQTGPAYRQVLVDLLSRDYPLDHRLIVYRAATLPIEKPRIRRLALRDLPRVPLTAEETVVLPPLRPMQPNLAIRERLAELDRASLLDRNAAEASFGAQAAARPATDPANG